MNDKTPIKLGFTCGFSSPYITIVENQLKGARLAVDEINEKGGIAGHPVVFLPKDDQMDPVMGRMMAEEFVQEKVDLLAGTISSSSQLETNRVARREGIPFMSVSQSNAITTAEHLGPYTFHEALTPYMTARLIGRWGMQHIGKKWVILIADYQWGWEILETLEKTVKQQGGKVLGVFKVPFGAKEEEFAKHMDKILALKPDVLSVTNLGWDQVNFILAANKFGLKREFGILHTVSDLTIVDAIPLSELVGMYWGVNFYWGLEDTIPTAKHFVQSFRDHYAGELPTGYAGFAYSGVKELLGAAQAIGRYPLDYNVMTKFMEGRSYDNYKGRQWWRPCDHQSFQDFYVLRFKAPEESKHHYDIGEIVGTVMWDLDIERSCEELGHHEKHFGHDVTKK